MSNKVAISVEQNWNPVPGGTARSTNRLISALQDQNDIELLGIRGRHRKAPTLPLPGDMALATIPIPGRLLVQAWNMAALPRIDRWLGDSGVVHAPAYVVPPSNRPTVVTVHDLAFRRHPEWFTAHGVAFLGRFLDRLVKSESVVVVPSQTTADDCSLAGIQTDRIVVVPWGVDAEAVAWEEAEAARIRYGVPERSVLFVGTIEPRKNLGTLALAMKEIPDSRLVVVGPEGWGDVTDDARMGGALFLGELPGDDVSRLMAAAALVAYPSHFEGFGLPVLEAMAQGTPVIVTSGTVPEEIAGAAGLAVDTRDASVLADAIRTVLDDQAAAGRMAEAGRARAAEFTWKAAAAGTTAAYRRAMA